LSTFSPPFFPLPILSTPRCIKLRSATCQGLVPVWNQTPPFSVHYIPTSRLLPPAFARVSRNISTPLSQVKDHICKICSTVLPTRASDALHDLIWGLHLDHLTNLILLWFLLILLWVHQYST
jgi:hypothetical protein